jgi:hypothetical protein
MGYSTNSGREREREKKQEMKNKNVIRAYLSAPKKFSVFFGALLYPVSPKSR